MLDEESALRNAVAFGARRMAQKLSAGVCLLTGAAAIFTVRLAEARGSYPALFAQADAEAEVSGPSYALDSLILIVLVAGAVFAVCRAGRRN